MDNYVTYHLHSSYSLLDSCTRFQDYVDYAASLGQKAICFTEHGNIFNWTKKKLYCESKGLKYLHGVEVYLTESHIDRQRDNYHTILIAKNEDGVKEINTLVSKSYNAGQYIEPIDSTDHFYYKPRISFDEFFRISSNVIKISACLASPLNRLPVTHPLYKKLVQSYDYLEIQPHIHSKEQIAYNRHLLQLSQQYCIPLIAGTDTHSLNAYKAECRTVLQYAKGIEFGSEDEFDLTYKSLPELIEMFRKQDAIPEKEWMEAIENTNRMADSVEEFDLDVSFKYPKLYGDSEADKKMLLQTERQLYTEKREKGIIPDSQAQAFIDAMQEENRVFEKVDMMGFMLFMSEMVRWAKSHDIPIGFNRGSCGGSRVAYVTDIIDLNPEQWHTVFSRFCNEDRKEIGDIDIDVAPDDRDKIYQYIINRFGSNKTAYILAIGTISEKGTIDEIGRALANIWEKDNLIDEKAIRRKIKEAKATGADPSSLEAELAKAKEHNAKRSKQNPYALDKIAEIKKEYAVNPNKAKKDHADVFYYFDGLLNTPISQSMHPAGIVASPITLYDNYGVLVSDGKLILQVDMDCVHDVSLVKYDILGLENIGIIRDACQIAGLPYPKSHEIDWDDQAVWKDMLRSPVGIFEFESKFAFDMLKRYEPHSIFDMSLVTAAIRPSGASYRDDLMAHKPHHNPSALLDDLLAHNYGYLIYQEDVIKFLTDICGFSGSDADNTRRAIARKDEDRLQKALPQILEGYCEKSIQPREVAEQEAQEFVQIIKDASSYMFGMNHSIGYCMIGYLCAYLRYYHPGAFIASYLNHADTDEKQAGGSSLASLYKIRIIHPKFGSSKSAFAFDPDTNTIAKGIDSVKYLNSQIADTLYNMAHQRAYHSFTDLICDVVNNKVMDARQTDVLIKIDYFEQFGNQTELHRIYQMAETFKFGDSKQVKKDKIAGKFYEDILIKYVDLPAAEDSNIYKFRTGIDDESLLAESKELKSRKKKATPEEKIGIQVRLAEIKEIIDAAIKRTVIAFLRECEEVIKGQGLDDVPLKTKMLNQKEFMGYVDIVTGKKEDRTRLMILSRFPLKSKKDGEIWAYSIVTKSIGTGKEAKFTVPIKAFTKQPVDKGDIIQALDFSAKTGKDNAKYWWMYDYIKEVI